MTLYRLSCPCGWTALRKTADVTRNKCPACSQRSLAYTPAAGAVTATTLAGQTVTWDTAEARWRPA